jgi:hypothetical protein
MRDRERRDKPAHCRGCESPTEKEKRLYSGLESCRPTDPAHILLPIALVVAILYVPAVFITPRQEEPK